MITKISFWENPMVSFQFSLLFLSYLAHLALLEIQYNLKRERVEITLFLKELMPTFIGSDSYFETAEV